MGTLRAWQSLRPHSARSPRVALGTHQRHTGWPSSSSFRAINFIGRRIQVEIAVASHSAVRSVGTAQDSGALFTLKTWHTLRALRSRGARNPLQSLNSWISLIPFRSNKRDPGRPDAPRLGSVDGVRRRVNVKIAVYTRSGGGCRGPTEQLAPQSDIDGYGSKRAAHKRQDISSGRRKSSQRNGNLLRSNIKHIRPADPVEPGIELAVKTLHGHIQSCSVDNHIPHSLSKTGARKYCGG